MNVSLEQAIDMHATALSRRAGPTAPRLARERARSCALAGDEEGRVVWLKVANSAESLLITEADNEPSAKAIFRQ